MTKERINLFVSKQTRKKIDVIQKRIDAESLSDVVRKAISLLDIISEAEKNGEQIVTRAEDGSETRIRLV